MTTEDISSSSTPLREQGNEEYKKGNYLKAAALYTKAIKEDPENAALYSNRSASLLQLNKINKALADAEKCIEIQPGWEKGHFRKGSALETLGNLEEALVSYQQAADCSAMNSGGVNSQAVSKARNLRKLINKRKK